MPELYCEKCHKSKDEKQFYGSNNLEKYPTGRLKQCKLCATMHIDNFDSSTYLPLMEECDVPYVPKVWNELLLKYGKDPSKLNGTSIFGRYLSQMKLKQWKEYRWKDTDFIQEVENKKLAETMKEQGYGAAEIAVAIEEASKGAELPEGFAPAPQASPFPQTPSYAEYTPDLSEDDQIYLCGKWGRMYRPDEWVQLEQMYVDMMNSYDIQTAGDKATLQLACKANLKANQLMDLGDIDGAQKATKMYDSMMKSGKWTAAQNKGEKGEFIDSVSEIVTLCEKEGFIPRFYQDEPQDKVDKVIIDTQHYVHSLVTEEMGLGTLIENAVKLLREEQDAINAASRSGEESADDSLFDYDKDYVDLSDDDYTAFNELEEEMEMADEEVEV